MNADEKEYQKFMNMYKVLRVTDGKKANKYLEVAMDIQSEGNVGDDIVLGMAYL